MKPQVWVAVVLFVIAHFGSVAARSPVSVTSLPDARIITIAGMDSQTEFDRDLQNIAIVRAVGSAGHEQVRDYIQSALTNANWRVEFDDFSAETPFGSADFSNIIATLQLDAQTPLPPKRLIVACHYDSKFFAGDNRFVGATDSAVPCAMLLDIARVIPRLISSGAILPVNLQLLFLDGEEAFRAWTNTDSVYGARHLAERWAHENNLDSIDMFLLLDLIGARAPTFPNMQAATQSNFLRFSAIEQRLLNAIGAPANTRKMFGTTFQPYGISDDHLPFMARQVPIVHVIAYPFPRVWHTVHDNLANVDPPTVKFINKIIRVFVAERMGLA